MSLTLDRQLDPTRPPKKPVGTIHLFGLLTIASMALVWANNEFVMTKDVLNTLAGSPHNTIQLDMQYETVRRMNVWGYAAAPIQTAFRIGFVALIVQIACLLGGKEISYGRLFRISAVAFGATLFGSFLQVFWIARQPVVAITQASLGIVPDSLAAWFGATGDSPSLSYLVMSRVSVTSLLWMLLLYWGLRETDRLRAAGAATVTAVTWLIVSGLGVGASLFVQKLVS